ncbi:hypothetical protein SOVF_210010 [Spinacia oleracea]|uniref:Transcription factor E2FB n=1 Tax=Spinacia oleracea TaxID=3562 RepID=A0A9R0HTD5_SPIOL|nr:transcription factor E2FB-like [Spinacia oleracea]KNA03356.1 hypothetical protein SOVF_210010 [Spinacia oleracea]
MTTPSASNDRQQAAPQKREVVLLARMKPPFAASPGEYYSFSDHRAPHLPIPDSIVVKTPPKKRKNKPADHNTESTYRTISQGCREVDNSSFQTPISGKGGKGQRASRDTSCDIVHPQTPLSIVGSPVENLTPSRSGRSLVLLTKKFINLIEQAKDGILDLKETAQTLEVQNRQKRRIYDITNVLEGIGLIEKLKNGIQWKGPNVSRPGEVDHGVASLQEDIENLSMEERNLDDRIREIQERLRGITEDNNNQKWLFVSEEDMKALPCFQDETLIAIKAPHGTTLEVPEPDEAVDYPQRRYRIVLRSTMGPIDVYLVSQFEEKVEETNGAETIQSLPSTSGCDNLPNDMAENESNLNKIELNGQEAHRMSSDGNAPQDLSGIMKILPEVYNDADYWLLSDADVSITDMWGAESGVDWDELGIVPEDYAVGDIHTQQQPQGPLSLSPCAAVVIPAIVDSTGR